MAEATSTGRISGHRAATLATVILAVVYALYFGWLAWARYQSFDFGDFDFALKTQILEAARHGSTQQTLSDLPFYANHANWIVFLAFPLYAWLGPVALLLFQAGCHALTAWPLFVLARRRLGGWPAFLVVLAVLHHPAFVGGQLYEVHPETWAIPALLGAVCAIETRRPLLFAACGAAAMLCKEDIPLAIMLLSLFAAMKFRHSGFGPVLRWCFPALLAGGYLAGMLLLKHHAAGGADLDHAGAYYYLCRPGETAGVLPTGTEVMRIMLTHPLRCLQDMLTGPDAAARLLYPVKLLAPFLFLPLLGRAGLLFALPFLIIHLISGRPPEWSMGYQYNAITLPFLAWALLDALARLKAYEPQSKLVLWTCGLLAASCIMWNVGLARSRLEPGLWLTYDWLLDTRRTTLDADDRTRADLIVRLPPQAPAVASFHFLSALAGSHYPLASMHFALAGVKAPGFAPYELPDEIAACLIDFKDPLNLSFWRAAGVDGGIGSDARLRQILSSRSNNAPWRCVMRVNSMGLFLRPDVAPADAQGDALPVQRMTATPVARRFAPDVCLEQVSVPEGVCPVDEVLPVELTWRITGSPPDYWVRLWLKPAASATNTSGFIVDTGLAFPAVPAGHASTSTVVDRLGVRCALPDGDYELIVIVFDRSAATLKRPLTPPQGEAIHGGIIRIKMRQQTGRVQT